MIQLLFPTGKYYIATMTMVTASTALTIFIMNIHHCGSEAHPVPQWAERFILNYLARICFVYEVGENCLDGTASRNLSQMDAEVLSANGLNAKGANWEVNGQALGGRTDEDVASKMARDATSETDLKEDLFVTIDHSEEDGAAPPSQVGKEESTSGLKGGGEEEEEQAEEKKGTGGKRGGRARGSRRGIFVRAQCVCQHQGLCRNIEYITSSYQDQRAAQLRIGEWRKVAKVMDRFFMWLFFIMVFIMSILILGKAI